MVTTATATSRPWPSNSDGNCSEKTFAKEVCLHVHHRKMRCLWISLLKFPEAVDKFFSYILAPLLSYTSSIFHQSLGCIFIQLERLFPCCRWQSNELAESQQPSGVQVLLKLVEAFKTIRKLLENVRRNKAFHLKTRRRRNKVNAAGNTKWISRMNRFLRKMEAHAVDFFLNFQIKFYCGFLGRTFDRMNNFGNVEIRSQICEIIFIRRMSCFPRKKRLQVYS